jgi:REP element-mobilizing transposase RayT
MPQHQITGDLESLLPKWSANLCVAFGWRLEAISTGPESISWVVGVSPTTSPAGHLKVMRQRTSRLIFDEFPILERGNPSGDFWAPGYMVSSSAHAPAPEIVRSFIEQTRRRQGIAPGSLP